ncbi:MAG: hypothetical protein A2664_04475 [Candidatus Taylorbacteria bacterium RIFCSPHIGHO2_01_FULL_46_22b]|uniref:Uncharacterized protein n=1 Tax=Candidatus Taylorbacteria bacterium RIFCSPHIGHO2_01_FULL_46_22b TaxID=1802301 RepID=A0A1G2M4P0_9BACT|nr:MAG: hypothetical protein A2664_04475 [Candidatus Taylorbacteria bacterium RIFCSPHIGHO2_01_FULL_46_22b]
MNVPCRLIKGEHGLVLQIAVTEGVTEAGVLFHTLASNPITATITNSEWQELTLPSKLTFTVENE